ncbi:MAG: hypothetical protein C4337_06590 [Armatimonadota bacterium]
MRLEFRTSDADEPFSWKRLLLDGGMGIGVFLLFLLIGHYLVAQLLVPRPHTPSSVSSQPFPSHPLPPKVEVYEKLPSDVVANTGAATGSREVAPFDYGEFERRRKTPKPSSTPPTPTQEEPLIQVPEEASSQESTETVPSAPESEIAPPDSSEPTASPPSPEPAEAPTPQARAYRVQVGVYEKRENANQLLQRLVASGFEASIVPFQSEGRPLYRVQTLVTRDRAKAEQAKQKLERQGFPAVIVAVP